jgi:hypothetical protein
MQSQRFVDLEHDRGRNEPYALTQAFHGYRPDLLCLDLRGLPQATGGSRQANLKRVDPPNVGCDWKDRDYTAPNAGRHSIRAVIAHDDGRTALARLRAPTWIEIDDSDLPSPH